MSTDTKHKLLVDSIAMGVNATLQPQLEKMVGQIAAENANIVALLASIAARLEILEVGGGAAGAKRAPRGERKTGGAAPKAAAAAAGDDPYAKVANAMLYFRRFYAEDEAFREKYSSDATAAKIEADDRVTKHAEGSERRLLAEASLIWRECLTDGQKKVVKDEFTRWKEDREKAALAPPLDADDEKAEEEA